MKNRSFESECNNITKEIDDIIQILSQARIERKITLYKKPTLTSLINACIFGVGLYLLIDGSIRGTKTNQEYQALLSQSHELARQLFYSWSTAPINGSDKHCWDYYAPMFACPPFPYIVIEFCKLLLVDYCQRVEPLQDSIVNFPSDRMSSLFIWFGLVLSVFGMTYFFGQLCFHENWFTQIKHQPNSHPYIPEQHQEKITTLANFLSIEMGKDIHLHDIIAQFKKRLHQIKQNKKRRLAFLEFSSEKHRHTHLYRFFKKDGASRDLTHQILNWADPLFPYDIERGNKENDKENVEDMIIEMNESTKLLSM